MRPVLIRDVEAGPGRQERSNFSRAPPHIQRGQIGRMRGAVKYVVHRVGGLPTAWADRSIREADSLAVLIEGRAIARPQLGQCCSGGPPEFPLLEVDPPV